MRTIALAVLLMSAVSPVSTAHAGNILQPVPVGNETARFDRGQPTITVRRQSGVMQIRPRALDHGSAAFDIAVFNNGGRSANFDTSNVSAIANGQPLRPFTVVELQKKAKSRAFWSEFGVALLAGTAAGLSASQRDTYTSTLYTPRGVYHGHYSAPSAAGQIAAAGTVVAGGVAIARIEEQLQATLASMQNNVIQMTTIDPGDSYAGMIILEKVKGFKKPQRIDLQVSWNNEIYAFAFQVVDDGTPMPVFATLDTAAESDNPNLTAGPPSVAPEAGVAPVLAPTNAVVTTTNTASAEPVRAVLAAPVQPLRPATATAVERRNRAPKPHAVCITCRPRVAK